MVNKSWGTGSPGFRVRTNLTLDERAAERAAARAARAAERSEANATRSEQQSARRDGELRRREQERQARREEEERAAAIDPHAAAARRPRSSGRKDVVRDQRDTRGYATVVDRRRIRELASRGASTGGLAAAFGISIEEVEQALAAASAD